MSVCKVTGYNWNIYYLLVALFHVIFVLNFYYSIIQLEIGLSIMFLCLIQQQILLLLLQCIHIVLRIIIIIIIIIIRYYNNVYKYEYIRICVKCADHFIMCYKV